VVGILLLDVEVAWYVLFIGKWNHLSQVRWVLPLAKVDFVAINNDILAKILISIKASSVWWRWLVDGPVVEWWVPYWVLRTGLNEIITVDSIDDHVSKLQVLVSSVTSGMWWRWLVNRPVVEWWIPHWVLSIKLNISGILLSKVELIWTNSNLNQTKISLSHSVLPHDGFWVNSDWRARNL
jgi:hypothetical protein